MVTLTIIVTHTPAGFTVGAYLASLLIILALTLRIAWAEDTFAAVQGYPLPKADTIRAAPPWPTTSQNYAEHRRTFELGHDKPHFHPLLSSSKGESLLDLLQQR